MTTVARSRTEILDELVRRIVAAVQPLRIILFGSAARGDPEAHDLDVMVVMPEGVKHREVAQLLYGSTGVGMPVDFLVATPSELARYANTKGLVYRNVVREGVDLYVSPDAPSERELTDMPAPSSEKIVASWMKKARADLAYAELTPPDGVEYDQACYHAQQAAEKALKALLLHHDQEPPYVHNIALLLELLATHEPGVSEISQSEKLTDYAVIARYPARQDETPRDPITEDDWRTAAVLARRVVEWVEARLQA